MRPAAAACCIRILVVRCKVRGDRVLCVQRVRVRACRALHR